MTAEEFGNNIQTAAQLAAAQERQDALSPKIALQNEVLGQWPNIPTIAVDYLAKHCTSPKQFREALTNAQDMVAINPQVFAVPENVLPIILKTCISSIENTALASQESILGVDNAARSERIETKISDNAALDDEIDQGRTTVIVLREKVYGNLTGDDKAGQLAALIQQVRTEPNFPKEERETALKQLGMIATALAEMSNVFTDDVKRSAFEQIVSSADIDLGAATLGETFAPVLAQVEAAGIFTETDKRRLRLIVTGSQAQDTLTETMTDENGKVIPVWPEDNPLQVRPGVSMYADGNQRQYLKAEYNGHITEIDTTGLKGETVGKYLEALSFVHDMESFGGTGILQSVYKIDFNLFGDEGFDMAKIDQILNIMGKLFGGLEHADGDIARAGQRQGYIRFLVRLLNKRGTAMGYEESQADTNEVISELQLHNPDGTPNWKQIEKLGQFAQRTYLSGDAEYKDLREFLITDDSQVN